MALKGMDDMRQDLACFTQAQCAHAIGGGAQPLPFFAPARSTKYGRGAMAERARIREKRHAM